VGWGYIGGIVFAALLSMVAVGFGFVGKVIIVASSLCIVGFDVVV